MNFVRRYYEKILYNFIISILLLGIQHAKLVDTKWVYISHYMDGSYYAVIRVVRLCYNTIKIYSFGPSM